MKILIADDSRAMRMILKQTLRQAGYGHAEIVEAEDGRDAAEKIRAAPPHLVLTDWNMPGVTGLQLLQWLQQARYRGVAGVVSSAATAQMRAQATSAGARFVISKPFTPDTFRHVLEEQGFRASAAASGSMAEANTEVASFGAKGVHSALAGAFRREVKVDPGPALAAGPILVARYVGEGGDALVLCDRKLALSLGAALTLLPPGIVQDAMRGAIPSNLEANVHEVFNLLVQVLRDSEGQVPRLASIEPAAALPRAAGRRLDLAISVAGYASGRIALIKLDSALAA